jgi:hypothetical protein
MTMIEVYPSTLPGEPLERHEVHGGTLHDWLTLNCKSYTKHGYQPVSASVNGVIIHPDQWDHLYLAGQTVEIRPNPRDPITWLFVAAAAIFVSVVLRPKVPSMNRQVQGNQLQAANLQANTPRLNGVIPEIAGQYKVFPDYLNQPRRYFSTSTRQTLNTLLCVGAGQFDINELYIGETKLSEFGSNVTYQVYQPGATISHPAAQNWHSANEVANTSFSAGIRLTASSEANMSTPGAPATLVGSAVTGLSFAASPISFLVAYNGVSRSATFNTDFANFDAVVDTLNTYFASYTDPNTLEVVPALVAASHSAGVITLTAQESASMSITISGAFSGVFGSSPVSTAGSTPKGKWIGPYAASPIGEAVSAIELDVFCPNGLGFIEGSGSISSRTRSVDVEWFADDATSGAVSFSISGATRDQIGHTQTINLPGNKNGVTVRVRRVEFENNDTAALDRMEWYGLRSLVVNNVSSYPDITAIAITLNGVDELSSRTDNQFNMLVTRRLNGAPDRTIGGWVRYVANDIGYGSTDINEAELSQLEAVWNARGDQFNFAQVDQTTVKETLSLALRAGFSELTIDGGKIRPVRDQARTVFEHLYTPQNMTAPVKRQFTSYDPDDYDGVDVEFTSSTSWQSQTVQCRLPGDAGTRVEKIKIDGVTDRTRAWRIGMRQRRTQVYRRKQYSFSTEWDALNSRYLSYCAIADDVPGYGQSAIVRAVRSIPGGVEITSSEPLDWGTGTHVAALRRPDGTLYGPQNATRVDDYRFTIPGTLDFIPVVSGAIESTHLLFGTVTNWSYPVLVTEISPAGDTVDVTAVHYDARIYADDDNTPA